MIIRVVIMFCLSFAASKLMAQPGTVSEAEINNQALFIEAERERLLEKYEEAIVLYKRVLTKANQEAVVHYQLARCYDHIEENELAVKAAKKAAELSADNPWYVIYLADLYQKVGNDAAAAQMYEELTLRAPNNEEYYYKHAYFLVRANQPQAALDVYETLEKKQGLNEELARRKHTVHLGLGDTKAAEKVLLDLIQIAPKNIDYQHLLAGFYMQNGMQQQAIERYKKIIQQNPNDTRALVALSKEHPTHNTNADWVVKLRPMFENRDIAIDAKIAQIVGGVQEVANTGNRQLAADLLQLSEILEQVHPSDGKGYSISADLLYYSQRKAEAADKYAETLEKTETIYLVWEQYLTTLQELHQWEKLTKESERALDVFPNQGTIYYFHGVGLNHTGQEKTAVSVLNQANMMAFNQPALQYRVQAALGAAFFYLDKTEQSDKSYHAALQINPDDPETLAKYAYSLAQRSDQLNKAQSLIERAQKKAGNHPLVQAAAGYVAFKKGKDKVAAEAFSLALENELAIPEVWEWYGDMLSAQGNKNTAVEYWQKAIEKGGSKTRLQLKIGAQQ